MSDVHSNAAQGADEAFVLARLNARVQPIDRGEVYEDPLDEMLRQRGLGEVTGGGTQLDENGEVAFCDVEIALNSLSEDALAAIRECLEQLGAPKGSKLLLEDDRPEIAFGVNEGLAVYLNGTDLPDSVYQECDIDTICDEFNRLLGTNGRLQGDWHGPTESGIYLYGPSYDVMVDAIRPFLDSYPLCQKARVVQIV